METNTIVVVDESWFTVDEVGEQLKVSPLTVRRWIREGRLRAVLLGGKKTGYRIRGSDLKAFIEQAEQEGERDG